MYFQVLQLRLIAILKGRVRNGELTERGLARLTGISQPHIHNVLKGARVLSPEIADQILETLKISIFDLFQATELASLGRGDEAFACRYEEIPLLEGRIGPGYPFPLRESPIERYPFLRSRLASMHRPVAARLAFDDRMVGVFGGNDLVLLDRSPLKRAQIQPAGLYVLSLPDGAAIRRLWLTPDGLQGEAVSSAENRLSDCISPPGNDILEIVLAKVVWIGRDMEQSESARQTPQETCGTH